MFPILFSFQIGDMPISIYGYGTCLAIAILAAFGLATHLAKKNGYDPDLFFYGGIIGLVAGLIGAKVLYWIVEMDRVIENPEIMLDLNGGFVVYGGVIAGILVPMIYITGIKKMPFLDKADLAFPCIALAQGIGRIGCFCAGCCYGKVAPEGAWYALHFPEGSSAPAGVGLYPTQLISAAGMIFLAVLLLIVYKKQKFRGETVSFYMVFYSVGRYLVEMLRDDDRGVVGPFSTSQLISIVIFVLGIVLFIVFSKLNYAPSSMMTAEEKNPPKGDKSAKNAKQEKTDAASQEPEGTKSEEASETDETDGEEADDVTLETAGENPGGAENADSNEDSDDNEMEIVESDDEMNGNGQ